VDAIYVATPHEHHARHAIAAARGKHVLVEKPMALTLEEARDMIEPREPRHAPGRGPEPQLRCARSRARAPSSRAASSGACA
jgi:hypothetical protein